MCEVEAELRLFVCSDRGRGRSSAELFRRICSFDDVFAAEQPTKATQTIE